MYSEVLQGNSHCKRLSLEGFEQSHMLVCNQSKFGLVKVSWCMTFVDMRRVLPGRFVFFYCWSQVVNLTFLGIQITDFPKKKKYVFISFSMFYLSILASNWKLEFTLAGPPFFSQIYKTSSPIINPSRRQISGFAYFSQQSNVTLLCGFTLYTNCVFD